MTKEQLHNKIMTSDNNEIEQLLMNYITALEIIENKEFEEIVDEYNVEFFDNNIFNNHIREKQISIINKLHDTIMNKR